LSHANGPEYVILPLLFLNKQIVISDDDNNGVHEPVGTAVLPGDRALLLDLQRRMLEIRFFEDEVMRLFMLNLVRGSTHL
jgi:TPP-dependent pyruvate/acetoin dehydrogenase alpha subunit